MEDSCELKVAVLLCAETVDVMLWVFWLSRLSMDGTGGGDYSPNLALFFLGIILKNCCSMSLIFCSLKGDSISKLPLSL